MFFGGRGGGRGKLDEKSRMPDDWEFIALIFGLHYSTTNTIATRRLKDDKIKIKQNKNSIA
jgi:hypothetical protein